MNLRAPGRIGVEQAIMIGQVGRGSRRGMGVEVGPRAARAQAAAGQHIRADCTAEIPPEPVDGTKKALVRRFCDTFLSDLPAAHNLCIH